jgi:hypothetical protein
MQVQVVDYRAPDAAEKFTRSLHETGFGVLTNHPIRQALVEGPRMVRPAESQAAAA